MRLLRLQLQNYCQHRQREIVFHEGVNALVGANGAGKTNSLNAVVWALTGVDRNTGKNADNVHLLAGPKEPCSVLLELEHAGACLTIERRQRPAGQSLGIEAVSIQKQPGPRCRFRPAPGRTKPYFVQHDKPDR